MALLVFITCFLNLCFSADPDFWSCQKKSTEVPWSEEHGIEAWGAAYCDSYMSKQESRNPAGYNWEVSKYLEARSKDYVPEYNDTLFEDFVDVEPISLVNQSRQLYLYNSTIDGYEFVEQQIALFDETEEGALLALRNAVSEQFSNNVSIFIWLFEFDRHVQSQSVGARIRYRYNRCATIVHLRRFVAKQLKNNKEQRSGY